MLVFGGQFAAGCSIVFTRDPAIPADPVAPVRCPESRAAPIADAVASAALLATGTAMLVYSATLDPARNEKECASCFASAIAVVPLLYGAGVGVTANFGFDRAARCRRIHGWQRECLAGDRAACRALQGEADSGALPPR